jgi:hypothetical protein
MASKEAKHTCFFRLEQTANGYLTGNLVCSSCGVTIPQTVWIKNPDPTQIDFSSSISARQFKPGHGAN